MAKPKSRARALAAATVAAYRKHVFALLDLSPLEIWHSQIDLEQQLKSIGNKTLRRKLAMIIGKARGEGLEKDDNFPRLIRGRVSLRIADKPPTIFHLDANANAAHKFDADRAFTMYRDCLGPDRRHILDRHKIVDLVFKAVGVGSVGTFCCIALLMTGDSEISLSSNQAGATFRIGAARRRHSLRRASGPACGGKVSK